MDFSSPDFWISVGQIILIDILLGGDNAVVIALACRRLPPDLRAKGVMWGVVGAVAARIILIFFALQLLALPFLKAVGALLLLWIGVKLMLPEQGDGHGKLEGGTTLWSAVRTVIVADAVMSLDNVIAVAAAADGHLGLVVFGILVSVPIIVWGSKFVLMLIDRFPLVVTLGAALLGWIAGGMLIEDLVWKSWYEAQPAWAGRAAAAAGAVFVVALGRILIARRGAKSAPAAASPAHGGAAVQRILIAADGSAGAARALQLALTLRSQFQQGADVELLVVNVQRPVSGNVASFVSGGSIDDYHREHGEQALSAARQTLQEAGVAFRELLRVGDPGSCIAEVAATENCDLIVMGTRGLGTHTGALLGSVTTSTLEHAGVPVLVVRA
jgi:YjbE family integral membrane protein